MSEISKEDRNSNRGAQDSVGCTKSAASAATAAWAREAENMSKDLQDKWEARRARALRQCALLRHYFVNGAGRSDAEREQAETSIRCLMEQFQLDDAAVAKETQGIGGNHDQCLDIDPAESEGNMAPAILTREVPGLVKTLVRPPHFVDLANAICREWLRGVRWHRGGRVGAHTTITMYGAKACCEAGLECFLRVFQQIESMAGGMNSISEAEFSEYLCRKQVSFQQDVSTSRRAAKAAAQRIRRQEYKDGLVQGFAVRLHSSGCVIPNGLVEVNRACAGVIQQKRKANELEDAGDKVAPAKKAKQKKGHRASKINRSGKSLAFVQGQRDGQLLTHTHLEELEDFNQ